jgi:hypothetical protein
MNKEKMVRLKKALRLLLVFYFNMLFIIYVADTAYVFGRIDPNSLIQFRYACVILLLGVAIGLTTFILMKLDSDVIHQWRGDAGDGKRKAVIPTPIVTG